MKHVRRLVSVSNGPHERLVVVELDAAGEVPQGEQLDSQPTQVDPLHQGDGKDVLVGACRKEEERMLRH